MILFFALLLVAAGLGLWAAARIDQRRSVLVHAPLPEAWERVRHFPTLHMRHGKSREMFRISRWELRHGDGVTPGSIWRAWGTWEGASHWADIELAQFAPGQQLAISLRRDSLGTHKGLRDHLGCLTLESVGPDRTKLSWRLCARLHGHKLILARLVDRSRLEARLFDQGLRSLKVEIDSARRNPPPAEEAADRVTLPEVPPPPARVPPETTL